MSARNSGCFKRNYSFYKFDKTKSFISNAFNPDKYLSISTNLDLLSEIPTSKQQKLITSARCTKTNNNKNLSLATKIFH